MSRALTAVVVLLALVAGVAWLAASPGKTGAPLAPGAAVARAANAPRVAAELADVEAEVASSTMAPAQAADERKAALSASEEELARAQWVEGRVQFPAGTPLDEEAFVVADGRDFGDGGDQRARVEPDGRFRVAFSEESRTGLLRLEARYLFLEEPRRWRRRDEGAIVLEPRLGGRIEARVLPPAGLSVAELGGDVKLSLVQPSADIVILGQERGSGSEPAKEVIAFGGLEPERAYTLAYDGERCVGVSAAVTAVAGLTLQVDVPLEMGLAIHGRVLDEGGTPLAGVTVFAHLRFDGRWFGGQDFRHARSGEDGTYRLGALRRGAVEVNFSLDGFEPFETTIEPPEGVDALERDFVLRRGHSIAGRVRWPDGAPAEAWLRLSPWPESGGDSDHREVDGRTSADGSFSLSGLTAGTYFVRAFGTKVTGVPTVSALTGRERTRKVRERWSAEVERVDLGARGLELVLGPGLSVRGVVRDASGEALEDFRVSSRRVSFPGNPWDVEFVPSERFRDSGGAFELTGFQPGTWSLRASAKDHVDSDAVQVQLPGTQAFQFTLEREAVVRGTVLDASGAPVADVRVSADQPERHFQVESGFGDDEVEDHSDGDGAFELDGLTGGRTILVATTPSGAPGEPLAVELVAGQTLEGVTLRLVPCGHLEGEVVDRDGQPDADVHVWIRALDRDFHTSATVDVAGRFICRDLPAGRLRVQATNAEGLTLQAEAEVRVGQTTRVRLAPPATAPVRLSGRVLAAGAPIAGARVSAHLESAQPDDPAGRIQDRAPTDEQGRYALVLPGSGRWLVSVHNYASGSGSWTTPLDVPEVVELQQDLVLALARISGRVTDGKRNPLEGIGVRSEPQRHDGGTRGSSHARTDAEGRYELVVPVGEHAVVAGGGRGSDASGPMSWTRARLDGLTLVEGERRTEVDFLLREAGALSGVVRGPTGAPLPRATVFVGERPPVSVGLTDGQGRFSAEGLEPGTHWVRAIQDHAATRSAVAVVIRAGAETQVVLDLAPGRIEIVRVVDAAGAPLGCEIEVLDADGRPVPVHDSGVQGSVRIGPLTAGRYRVTVRREDKRFEQTLEVSGSAIESETVVTFP